MRSFPGGKTKCMKNYKKPSIRDVPDQFILHIGTYDLNSELSSESTVESIAKLAMSLKAEMNDVSIFFIIIRMETLI